MRFWFLAVWLFLVCGVSAFAQTTAQPRILVIGDGLAGGLGAGLTRMAEEGEPVVVDNRFDEISGFTRPEAFSWSATITGLTPDVSYTDVVILSGINDKREFRKGADRLVFGTPEWKTAFIAEVDLLLDALKAKNIKTFWVSLPPMQNLTFDTEMQLLNIIHKERVTAKGGVYLDIRKSFLNETGQYTDLGPDKEGNVRKLRSRDGVTFFKNGNNLLASVVLEGMRNGIAITPSPIAPSIAPTSPAPIVSTQPLPSAPVFAQQGPAGSPEGSNVVVSASDIKIVMKPPTIEVKSVGLAAGSLGQFTPLKGTAAEALFSTGEVKPPPAGRFDDFFGETP